MGGGGSRVSVIFVAASSTLEKGIKAFNTNKQSWLIRGEDE